MSLALLKSLDQAYSAEATSLRVKMESILAEVQRGNFFESSIGKGSLVFDFSALTKDFARKLTLLKMKSNKLNGEQEILVTEKIMTIGGNFSSQCRQMISTIETVLVQAGKDYLNAAFDAIKTEIKQVPSSVSISAEEVTQEVNQKVQNVHSGIQKILASDATPTQAATEINSEYATLEEKLGVFLQKRAYNNDYRSGKVSSVPDLSEFPVSQKDLEKFISDSVKELRKEMIAAIERLVVSQKSRVGYGHHETPFCGGFRKQQMIIMLNEKYQACLNKLTKRAKCTKNSNLGTKLDNLFQNACGEVTGEADTLYQEKRDSEVQVLVAWVVETTSKDCNAFLMTIDPRKTASVKKAKEEFADLWNTTIGSRATWFDSHITGWDFASQAEKQVCKRNLNAQLVLRMNESLTQLHKLLDRKSPVKKRGTSAVAAPAPALNRADRKIVMVKPSTTTAAAVMEEESPAKKFRSEISESSASKKRGQRTPASDASSSAKKGSKKTSPLDTPMDVEEVMDPVKVAKFAAAAALQQSADAFAARTKKGRGKK